MGRLSLYLRSWRQRRRPPLMSCKPPVRHAALPAPEHPPEALREASLVYVRRGGTLPPLTPPYDGPFRVLSRTPKYFKIQVGPREEVISVDRLKPHRGATVPVPAQLRPRGRPARIVSAALTYTEAVAGGGPCGRGPEQ